MKIPYVLLDFSGEVSAMTNWDMALIKDMLDGNLWKPAQGYEFEEVSQPTKIPSSELYDGCVVVIPARQNAGFEDDIYSWLCNLEWSLVMLVGDEERLFDVGKIRMPKTKIWLMQPTLEDEADYYLGSGYPPHARFNLAQCKSDYMAKPLDWFFSGQNNHPRREEAAKILRTLQTVGDLTGELIETEGFTQGQMPAIYDINMAKAKAVPCPSGIQSPDSFRVFEALEAGAVPIADDLSHVLIQEPGYWFKVFNGHDVPFKIYSDKDNISGYIHDVVRDYPMLNNKVFSWWQNIKHDMVYALNEQVRELSGLEYNIDDVANKITIIILTSPIKSHPSTKIIDQTITDLRKVLPDCEILIGIDGVRAEQEHYRERYEDYQKELLWKCNHKWRNVLPVRFEEHMHQAAMTRQLLKLVKTEAILFVEHDTSLAPDFDYPWQELLAAIESGEAYTIRFHFEAVIPEDHKPLMIGEPEQIQGVPMLKTAQWSQRPHLSSTAFYRDMMDRYFTDESRTMIEDKVHGYPHEAYRSEGLQGWYQWRLWIYYPDESNIKRSYTTDGRGDDPKYEMVF